MNRIEATQRWEKMGTWNVRTLRPWELLEYIALADDGILGTYDCGDVGLRKH